MIFIIGVNHEIQYLFDYNSASTEKFKKYLKTEAVNRDVTLIAEELSKEAISREAISREAITRRRATDSVAKIVALSIGMDHKFCDPDSKTREKLGIPSLDQIKKELGLGFAISHHEKKTLDIAQATYHHIREKYWFSLIKDQASSNVIFICGDEHVDNFKKLVANSGYPTKVLNRNWR